MKIKKMLKKSLKFLFSFLVKLCQSLLSVFFVITKTDLRNHIPLIKDAGPLTILANGPSLKDVISKLDNSKCDFCVVNDFYLSPYYKIIKPRFHVLADPLYFVQSGDIEPFIKAIDWDIVLYVPYGAWKKMEILHNMPSKHITVIPFHHKYMKGFDSFELFLFKRGLSMPGAQNVLVPSIFNAINMGYKEIYLYGADHSWTKSIRVNDVNQVCLTDSHFYDEGEVKLAPWRKATPGREICKMHEILTDLTTVFKSYHIIRKYANLRNCSIINKTKDSFIDAFERA